MPISTLTGTAVAGSVLIDRAMRLIEQISPGVSPTTEEYTTCLEAMNAMLDGWRNEGLMSNAVQDESLVLTANDGTYTIGDSGNFNTSRPTKILGAYIVDSANSSYWMTMLNYDEYAAISLKASTSTYPDHLYYAPDVPLGTIYLWPVPTLAYTLHILTPTPMMAFATTATTAYLQPGWRDAIAYNLAVRIAPEFEREASPTVMQMASISKAGIKRANSIPLKIKSDLGALLSPRHMNILTNA